MKLQSVVSEVLSLELGMMRALNPASKFFPVANCGIAAKKFPAAQKVFSPQTTIINETSDKAKGVDTLQALLRVLKTF